MGTDILALYAKDCAVEGGYTYLSPAARIYEDLVAGYPEELELLMSASWPIQMCVHQHFQHRHVDYNGLSALTARND